MKIDEHLHNHLASANTILTKLQAEKSRTSGDWQQLVAAIAYVRAAMAIAQFLPPLQNQAEQEETCEVE